MSKKEKDAEDSSRNKPYLDENTKGKGAENEKQETDDDTVLQEEDEEYDIRPFRGSRTGTRPKKEKN